jgi:cytochrome d ubiquinol oxidase subunit I
MSISAWYLLKGRHQEFAQRSFTGGLMLATICSVAQLFAGDWQARIVVQHQPAKLAAMEGQYRTQARAPLHLIGWPNDQTEQVDYGVKVPGMLSWLVHGDMNQPVRGLAELEPQFGRPPVWLTFQSFHVMILIGVLFIMSTLYASFCRWRGTLFTKRWLMWYFVFAVILAFVANEAGWVAAEVGRQPWSVYPSLDGDQVVGGLRTSDSLSEAVSAEHVLASIVMFGLVYLLLFVLWLLLLNHKIQQGPEPVVLLAESSPLTLLEAASKRIDHDDSLTEAKRPPPMG